MDILLAAPTGRAAKRMTEATGCQASDDSSPVWKSVAIRKMMIETIMSDLEHAFGRNAENPLEADVIIIDEMSMVDMPLMHALLDAISAGNQTDSWWEMSISCQVWDLEECLKDMIDRDCFPVVKLKKIFRQAKESDIVVNAHKINRGETSQNWIIKARTFSF